MSAGAHRHPSPPLTAPDRLAAADAGTGGFPATLMERLRFIRQTVQSEADAISAAAKSLSTDAVRAAEMTSTCDGCVVVTGVGKAGLVGRKLVATLASTGSPSHFLHPSEAVHGDLGCVRKNDLVWAISNSGTSEEVVRIAPHLKANSRGLITITADTDNPLAAAADCAVTIGRHGEACPNGLAPTNSTAVMMAAGDAIAMLASRLRNFSSQDFARFHPGGALGRKLTTVDQVMRPLDGCRIAASSVSVRQALTTQNNAGRRSGAVMLVDDRRHLAGIFTDSDLARMLESCSDRELDEGVAKHMTASPLTVTLGSRLDGATAVLAARQISELPVVDSAGRPVGMIDITDLVSLGYAADESATLPIR